MASPGAPGVKYQNKHGKEYPRFKALFKSCQKASANACPGDASKRFAAALPGLAHHDQRKSGRSLRRRQECGRPFHVTWNETTSSLT